MTRRLTLFLLLIATASAVACGNSDCHLTAINVSPSSATADHSAAAPGNQAQFAANGEFSANCVQLACVNCLQGVTWSVSDPANVSLTPVTGQSVVVATCIANTSGSVTVTATAPVAAGSNDTVVGTASLTCH